MKIIKKKNIRRDAVKEMLQYVSNGYGTYQISNMMSVEQKIIEDYLNAKGISFRERTSYE